MHFATKVFLFDGVVKVMLLMMKMMVMVKGVKGEDGGLLKL